MDTYFRKGSELFSAARKNDSVTLKLMLENEDFDPFCRGNLEETVLHTALLTGGKEAVEVILDTVPSLINEPITSHKYKGETPLHIAILKQNLEIVQDLIIRGADILNARATGACFVPGKECQCYLGEYPLSFAACVGNEEMVKLLISHGAPLEAQDSLGNTVLHVLALQPNKEKACKMYDFITSLIPSKHIHFVEGILNTDGLTAFKLAAAEANIVMFNYFIKKKKKIYWTMGTVSYCVYDLTQIDTWKEKNSVLDIITTSRKPEISELIDVTPVKQLLLHKWKSFGYKYFLIWMCSYIIYVIIFTLCSLYRPLKLIPPDRSDNITIMEQETISESYVSVEDYLRLLGELITIAGAIVILFSEVPYFFRIGTRNIIRNASIRGPFPILMILYSVLIFVTVTMRVLENKWESIPMSMALIIGWCNTIYFARGFKMLGQFSIMIQKIIFGDLLQWFCLLFISIIGFSTAFHIIFQTLDLNSYIYFQDYSMTLYTTVELLMGLIDLPVDPNKSTPVIVFIMYVLYMIFAYLLMLNLLIAMMDDTFWRIAQEREQLWKVQIAASILLLEQRLPKYFKFRSGLSGRSLGFDDDAWYLGIEELMNEKRRRKGPVNADVMLKANIGWEILRRNLTKIINMKEDEFTYF